MASLNNGTCSRDVISLKVKVCGGSTLSDRLKVKISCLSIMSRGGSVSPKSVDWLMVSLMVSLTVSDGSLIITDGSNSIDCSTDRLSLMFIDEPERRSSWVRSTTSSLRNDVKKISKKLQRECLRIFELPDDGRVC